jgi:hypothetical protein
MTPLRKGYMMAGSVITNNGGQVRLRQLARVLDDLIRIPGTNIRVGLDPLLGLLPGGGDVAGGLIAAYTLMVAARMGAPPAVILRMAGNIAVDALFGIVPVLGDLFDVGWKANRRNVELLERYVDAPQPVRARSRMLVVVVLVVLALLLIGVAVVSVVVVRWLIGVLF